MKEGIEVRTSFPHEETRLKEMWKLAFGDEDSYINGFFKHYYRPERVMTLHYNGTLVSAIHMFPLKALVFPDGKHLSCSCVYALATDPKYRGNDFGMKCMDASLKHLAGLGYDCSVQCPAEDSLFTQYEKRIGYSDFFYIREARLCQADIRTTGLKPDIYPATPLEYNRLRNEALSCYSYVAYDEDAMNYQNTLCKNAEGGLFEINYRGILGCATVEKLSEGIIFIKEILVPDELIIDALSRLSELFPSKSYIVRTPSDRGKCLGGATRRFAMIMFFNEHSGEKPANNIAGYFGLAFD